MDEQYSSTIALLYVFNLIVGTGALTLPKAFLLGGWVFSVAFMILLAFMSFLTTTFVVEAMSTCNAIIQWTKVDKMKRVSQYLRAAIQADAVSDEGSTSEDATLLTSEYIENFPSEPQRFFTIDRKIELSEMATVLFSKVGKILFYICLCLYLFGDLTIYSAAIGKSLVDATCLNNGSLNISDSDCCWKSSSLTRGNMYQIYLVIFLVAIGPFAFFNVQKTKYLQVTTSLTRWLAFIVMIGLTVQRLCNSSVKHGHPALALPSGLPALLGAGVYSFMCHHSLPSMLSPMADKTRLLRSLALDYLVILIFYLSLSLTAVFAFPNVEDLYTLNFVPSSNSEASFPLEIINYFLTLFPIFTLTASFPIIAVTLRNNFQAMFSQYESWALHKLCLPTIVILIPVLIASTTENIEILVGITGSYMGVGIQYLIPAGLVILARKSVPDAIASLPNLHTSPFRSMAWPFLVIIWAFVCLVLVTFNIIENNVS